MNIYTEWLEKCWSDQTEYGPGTDTVYAGPRHNKKFKSETFKMQYVNGYEIASMIRLWYQLYVSTGMSCLFYSCY